MDPNATIQELRKLLGGDHSGLEDTNELLEGSGAWANDTLGALCRAEELFQALDGWLKSGGALPKAWEVSRA